MAEPSSSDPSQTNQLTFAQIEPLKELMTDLDNHSSVIALYFYITGKHEQYPNAFKYLCDFSGISDSDQIANIQKRCKADLLSNLRSVGKFFFLGTKLSKDELVTEIINMVTKPTPLPARRIQAYKNAKHRAKQADGSNKHDSKDKDKQSDADYQEDEESSKDQESSDSMKKKSLPKDPQRPKLPLSSYQLFIKESADQIQKTYMDANPTAKRATKVALQRTAQEMWAAMSADEKAVWHDKQAQAKEQYKKEMEEYTKSGRAELWEAQCRSQEKEVVVRKYTKTGRKHPTTTELTTKLVEYIELVMKDDVLSLHELRCWLEDQFQYPLNSQRDLDLIRTITTHLSLSAKELAKEINSNSKDQPTVIEDTPEPISSSAPSEPPVGVP